MGLGRFRAGRRRQTQMQMQLQNGFDLESTSLHSVLVYTLYRCIHACPVQVCYTCFTRHVFCAVACLSHASEPIGTCSHAHMHASSCGRVCVLAHFLLLRVLAPISKPVRELLCARASPQGTCTRPVAAWLRAHARACTCSPAYACRPF